MKKSNKYAGTKVVEAELMTVKEAEKILGRKIDMTNHEGETNGYLMTYKDGYQSFSPKSVFEEAYVRIEDSFRVSFSVFRKCITPEMLRQEFMRWQEQMVKKYDVTMPDFRIDE